MTPPFEKQSGKHVFVDATNAECLAAPCRLVAAFTDHGNLVALQQDSQLELEFARVDALVDVSAGLSS